MSCRASASFRPASVPHCLPATQPPRCSSFSRRPHVSWIRSGRCSGEVFRHSAPGLALCASTVLHIISRRTTCAPTGLQSGENCSRARATQKQGERNRRMLDWTLSQRANKTRPGSTSSKTLYPKLREQLNSTNNPQRNCTLCSITFRGFSTIARALQQDRHSCSVQAIRRAAKRDLCLANRRPMNNAL